jgi:hypothetical protein
LLTTHIVLTLSQCQRRLQVTQLFCRSSAFCIDITSKSPDQQQKCLCLLKCLFTTSKDTFHSLTDSLKSPLHTICSQQPGTSGSIPRQLGPCPPEIIIDIDVPERHTHSESELTNKSFQYLHHHAHSSPSSNLLLCFLDSMQIRTISTDTYSALTLVALAGPSTAYANPSSLHVRMMHVLKCLPGICNELVKQNSQPSASTIQTLSMTDLRNTPAMCSKTDAEESNTFWKVFRGRIGSAWS